MVTRGNPPFLECSTKGDKRFSPFFATFLCAPHLSIEDAYHASKIFDDGTTGLTWRQAKEKKKAGFKVINQQECNEMYSKMWDLYIQENPHLLDVLKLQSGLSDIFGKEEGPCQAIELWRIRNENM